MHANCSIKLLSETQKMCRALRHWRQIFPWTFSWIFLWFRLVWYSFRQYLCKTELFGNSIILGIMRRVAGVVWQSSEQAWSIQTVSCCGRYVRRRSLNDSCSYWHDSNTHTHPHTNIIYVPYIYITQFTHIHYSIWLTHWWIHLCAAIWMQFVP